MMEHEEWRPIPGYEGRYEASNLGRIRSVPTILQPSVKSHGYHQVTLYTDGKQKHEQVHRLVALAFHGPPPSPRHQANHKDFDRGHNAEDNLDWMTPSQNVLHTYRAGRNSFAKLDAAAVKEIQSSKEPRKTLAERFGVTVQTIGRAARGQNLSFSGASDVS